MTAALIAASTGVVTPSNAETASYDQAWVDETPAPLEPSPPERLWTTMAYHPPSQRTVLFGGQLMQVRIDVTPSEDEQVRIDTPVEDDTWTWNGKTSTWHEELPATSPPARTFAAMAYDDRGAGQGDLVLFGGFSDAWSVLDDTWTWNGTTWQDVTPPAPGAGEPPTSPPARWDATLSEDADGNVVLFGGLDENGEYLSDTWIWDGTTWSQATTARRPPARAGAVMAYHAKSGKVVLTGGEGDAEQENSRFLTDTWTWNGSKWTKEAPVSKPPELRGDAAMAYHAEAAQNVLVAGQSTWTWDGSNWALRAPPSGTPVAAEAMSYDPHGQRVVLFAGDDLPATNGPRTWTWDAQKIGQAPEEGSTRVTMTFDPPSIAADGESFSKVMVKVTAAGGRGVPGMNVRFETDGDFALPKSARDLGGGSYETVITASRTPGRATVVATADYPVAHALVRPVSTAATFTETPWSCQPSMAETRSWSDLDPSFGCGGKVVGDPSMGLGVAMAIQRKDDRILVATDHSVVRFLPDGALDRSFGDNGKATLDRDGELNLSVQDLTVQGDKIVVLTISHLIRLHPDGKVDTNFGEDGKAALSFPSLQATPPGRPFNPRALTIGPDDQSIVIAGIVSIGGDSTSSEFGVARFLANGTPDEDFGSNGDGMVTTRFGTPSQAHGIAVQGDKIVLGGFTGEGSKFDFAVARYNRDGSLDQTFNRCGASASIPCGGQVVTNAQPGSYVFGSTPVGVAPDGKIVISAPVYKNGASPRPWQGPEEIGFGLVRYKADGTPDPDFNPCGPVPIPPCGGVVVSSFFPGWKPRNSRGSGWGPPHAGLPAALEIQEDGKILVAGKGPYGDSDFLVARYRPDGALDTCGSPGFARTYVGGPSASAGDVLIQSGGRIVAGGYYQGMGKEGIALAGYVGKEVKSANAFSVSPPEVGMAEPASGSADMALSVSLAAPACEAALVDYVTTDGSATAPNDYGPLSGTLAFAKGDQTKTITIPVLADNEVEPDETFSLELVNPRSAGAGSSAGLDLEQPRSIVTIRDHYSPPTLGIGDVTVAEPNSESVPANFTVTLSRPAMGPVTVRYSTADASAKAGADYESISGTVTIPTGATTASVTVPVLGDIVPEPTESFVVELSEPTEARLDRARGTATILDAGPGISVGDATVVEGNAHSTPARFTVTLNAPPIQAVSVDYATAHGSAGANDYDSASGTLRFAPGERSKVVTVEVVADTLDEDDEVFTVGLSNPGGASLRRAVGRGTILDDDEPPASSPAPIDQAGPGARGSAAAATTSGPPPALVTQTQLQGQSQAQAQQQGQAQSQAQSQTQLQQQGQLQAQLEQQAHIQAQSQAQLQPGLMLDRERQLQLERVGLRPGGDRQSHLAASRRRSVPVGAAGGTWVVAAAVFVVGLVGIRDNACAAQPARSAIRRSRRNRRGRRRV